MYMRQGASPLHPPRSNAARLKTDTDLTMAIFYFAIKTICRSAKHTQSANFCSGSAVQKAAYMTSKSLQDERTGITHNYQHGRGKKIATTIDLGITFADGSKIHTREKDRHNAYARFWSKVEQEEKRKDARTARSLILALPYELDKEKNKQLVQKYADHLAKAYGCAVHAVIHLDDPKNPHAHLLLTTREAKSDGSFGEKIRILDTPKSAHFELDRMRKKWMELNNEALKPYGVVLDHRSYKRQGIDKKPGKHETPAQHHMKQKEIVKIEAEIEKTKKEAEKMQNALKPTAPKKTAPPPPKKKEGKAPQTPPLTHDKAQALYRFHHEAAAKIKKGKTEREIADLTALRIRACGHDVHTAMQIMADDPHMRDALTAAYTPEGTTRLQKLAPYAPQLKAQERQALAEKTPQQTQTQAQKLEQPQWQQHSSAPAM